MKKKILIIDNGNLGIIDERIVINRYTNNFIQELSKKGVEITVAQFATKISKNDNLLDSELTTKVLPLSQLRIKYVGKVISYILATIKLILSILKQDFVYVFFPGHLSFIVALLSKLLGKNYGIYLRGEYIEKSFLHSLLIRSAQTVVTITPKFETDLIKRGINAKVILPMFNLDIPNFNRAIVQKSNWQLLFVGRVEEKKGIYELIKACEILIEKGFSFHLHIVGGGILFNIINQKIQDDPTFRNYITLHGFIGDKIQIEKLYKKCDIFLLPTYTEGFPRVLYDAMKFRLPIITTLVGGIPGYLEKDIDCLELEVRSVESIVDNVCYLTSNIDKMQFLSENANKKIRNIFSQKDLLHQNVLFNVLNND